MDQLKVGYVIRGRVPKQTCSQSAVRGVSTRDMKERAFSEQPSNRKIEMADKNNTGKRLRKDKARSRTRVNIESAFRRWRELKERKACDRTPVLLCFFSIGQCVYIGRNTLPYGNAAPGGHPDRNS